MSRKTRTKRRMRNEDGKDYDYEEKDDGIG